MKQLFSKASLLLIGGALLFSSCEKDDPQPSSSSGGSTSTETNEYLTTAGSAQATLSGTIDGYSNYDGQGYTIDKKYTFIQDHIEYASNKMTTKRYYNTNGSYDYNEHYYTIQMYAASGADRSSYSLNDYIEISFSYYTGVLSQDALLNGTVLNTPMNVSLRISATYNPENTIDKIPLSDSYYNNNVDIDDFSPADASGNISFTFSTVGINDINIQNGSVSTTVLYNEILYEDREGSIYNPDPDPQPQTVYAYFDYDENLYTYDSNYSVAYIYYDDVFEMYYYYDSYNETNFYFPVSSLQVVTEEM